MISFFFLIIANETVSMYVVRHQIKWIQINLKGYCYDYKSDMINCL